MKDGILQPQKQPITMQETAYFFTINHDLSHNPHAIIPYRDYSACIKATIT